MFPVFGDAAATLWAYDISCFLLLRAFVYTLLRHTLITVKADYWITCVTRVHNFFSTIVEFEFYDFPYHWSSCLLFFERYLCLVPALTVRGNLIVFGSIELLKSDDHGKILCRHNCER